MFAYYLLRYQGCSPVKAVDVETIEVAVSRTFMKIFNTYSADVVNDRKLFVGIELLHEIIRKRRKKIKVNYCSTNDIIRPAISNILLSLTYFLIFFSPLSISLYLSASIRPLNFVLSSLALLSSHIYFYFIVFFVCLLSIAAFMKTVFQDFHIFTNTV